MFEHRSVQSTTFMVSKLLLKKSWSPLVFFMVSFTRLIPIADHHFWSSTAPGRCRSSLGPATQVRRLAADDPQEETHQDLEVLPHKRKPVYTGRPGSHDGNWDFHDFHGGLRKYLFVCVYIYIYNTPLLYYYITILLYTILNILPYYYIIYMWHVLKHLMMEMTQLTDYSCGG